MNGLVEQCSNLPAAIEDLSRFVLVGREKITAVRAEIRAINKLGLASGVREQKLKEAQMISDAVLDAEVRIGELTASMPKARGGVPYHNATTDSGVASTPTKQKAVRELGFTPKQVERFEKLAKYPEIVAEAKAEARENDDIVSRSLVLQKIKEAERQNARVEIKTTPPKQAKGRYSIIYADPPWRYDFSETESRAIENQYPTMTLDDIKNIKVPCEDNAVLFLWATAPKLKEAIEVMDAWGFMYRSCAVWDKAHIGMGYWFRGQHELLLVGVKGVHKAPLPEVRVSSVYKEARGRHSAKPNHYYKMIESMFPNESYLELFARTKRDGWEVWGNQAQ